MALGLLAGMLGTRLLARMDDKHLQPTAWSLRLVALLLAAAAYTLATEALDFDENRPLQTALVPVVLVSLWRFVQQNRSARVGLLLNK
jgi:NhaP-type Na+/H+ or K+/H+ antiporter